MMLALQENNKQLNCKNTTQNTHQNSPF